MAVAGSWVFANGTVPGTPGAGLETLYFDTADTRFKFLGSDAIVHPLDMTQFQSSTAASAAINTTSTIISGGTSGIHLSANQLTAGSMFRVRLLGTNTSTVANNSTFTLYYGTAGTTSDTALATFIIASAASGSAVPFCLDLVGTFRTVGASGTLYGFGILNNGGATTGIYTAANYIAVLTGTLAIASNAAGYFNVGYLSAATTTTTTFQNVQVEIVKQ
jgi:hypothetical protein